MQCPGRIVFLSTFSYGLSVGSKVGEEKLCKNVENVVRAEGLEPSWAV